MSMTTELVQRMKASAIDAYPKDWRYSPQDETIIDSDSTVAICRMDSHLDGEATALNAEHISSACPSNVLVLIEVLEAMDKQIAELVNGRLNIQRTMGVYVHAYEEAKEQIAKDGEIKARLCLESNSLFDRLRAAEKRIAELEARTITVKFEPIPMEELGNRRDGKKHPYMFGAGYNSAVVHCESVLHQACAAAGIGVKGE